jgi:hypothetical protein
MSSERESLKPIEGANRSLRRRLNLGGESARAGGPTLTGARRRQVSCNPQRIPAP